MRTGIYHYTIYTLLATKSDISTFFLKTIFAHVTHIKMDQHMIFWYVKPQKNAYSDLSGGDRSQKFGLILHHHPFFVYRSSKGSNESALLRRLARDFTARKCNKNPNPMYWFKFSFKERMGYLLYSQATILAWSTFVVPEKVSKQLSVL